MSNTDLNDVINNLSNSFNSITTSFNTIQQNQLYSQLLPKTNGSMNGILNVSNIDSSSNLIIGNNSTSITLGSTNNINPKTINIGGSNDTINMKYDVNMNSNKLYNVSKPKR